jgi:hypothetical protein
MSQVGEKPDAPEAEDVEVETPEVEEAAEQAEDEPEEEAEEGDEPEEQEAGEQPAVAAQPAKPRSAATIAVQEAKRAAKEAKAEAERARQELNELRMAAQGRQTEEQRRIEAERLALMPPEEKFDYLLNKQKQEFDGRYRGLEFQMQDNADRVAFEALCARNPAFEAVREDVERQLMETRRNGGNVAREVAATYFIGKRALERAAKGSKTKQAAKGTQRVAQAAAKPSGGRSDVRGGERRGGSEAEARRQRLSDMEI